ncbi:membrane Transport [Methylobacterium phyllosphaerae]|uniref:Amino acid/amide ABC transporter substrate-binding protein, HAAT family n=1 Tax=Methylobacterium phyllosphaerae TaxID=418223 RepID=A0AAE8HMY4_9HYPH|nr:MULTISPECIES: ABC transporter substrate-binding protein [Methylobacterium]APT30730.1 membrane Transport [Methylobacterium phyllosphaerae]MDH3027757.1 ABC transporter substrate-binding protein [Methylobacterium fujisawaense]SFG24419.1 amino acid/amide ABC transporter substrate-binding protein, HAAT family [Methylobacterium phyllosphaerae]
MSETVRAAARVAPIRRMLPALIAAGLVAAGPVRAADPIKIGVIAEAQSVAGASIPQAVQLAADEINAKGGIDGRQIQVVTYDDKSSASDAVRAFQRAVSEDKVNVVIASYISEVVLALMPWAARLKTPMITPGAASNEISVNVHKDYARNKYTFHGYLTSHALAQAVCDSAKEVLVGTLKAKTAAIMSEDAAWTRPLDAAYQECLPKSGLKVVEHVRFSPDTGDFTPIYNKIEAAKPDLIVTGIAHVGVQPTVQWQNQQVPIAMTGISGQATSSTFWANTNGGTQGVLFDSVALPGVALTEKTIPFAEAFTKRFGGAPSYAGYMAYDAVYYTAEAIKRAGSTEADKLVEALEKTDYVGTVGHLKFYGKDDPFTHSIQYGPGLMTSVLGQWQNGKQVAIWPAATANGTMILPPAVKAAVP